MSKDHHRWVPNQPAPLIRAHSLAKHRVIEGYLRRYVETLTRNPRQPRLCLTLIDGFAGGGAYRDADTLEFRPGSPLIVLDSMKFAAEQAQQFRVNPFHLDVEYFFIEKNRGAFEFLTNSIRDSEFAPLVGNQVTLIRGELSANVDGIINRIKSRGMGERAIFVLDQCGINLVDLR